MGYDTERGDQHALRVSGDQNLDDACIEWNYPILNTGSVVGIQTHFFRPDITSDYDIKTMNITSDIAWQAKTSDFIQNSNRRRISNSLLYILTMYQIASIFKSNFDR